MPLVVVVEDDPDVQQMLAALLQDAGYDVRVASDGPRALEVVRQSRPDLVLLDVTLPGALDGFDVARLLRANVLPDDVPVLAVTARVRPEDRRRGEEAGVNDYLAKPHDIDDLLSRIARYLT